MMAQTNLVDLQKIPKIPPEIAQIIQQTLELPTPHVPVGLLDAANEILIGEGIAPIGVACPPIPRSDAAQLANCELISHIASGPPSLVVKQKGMSVLPLVERICATFSKSRIIVTVSNKRTAIETVNFLRNQGEDCWFLSDEYKLLEGEAPPDHRIKIVLEDMLYLCSLQLHLADIVVVTDAARFVNQKIFGFGVDSFFDIRFGTHFMEDVRLVGIIDEEVPPKNMREVWSVFGLGTYLLNPQGEAYLTPRVTWITRSKQDRSLFASGLTTDSTHREKMKTLVWENLPRNQSVLKIARRLQKEAHTYPFVSERYGNSVCNPVAIVTENLLHRRVLVKMQDTQKVRVPVMAFEDVEKREDLPSFLLRADAGTGLLPLLAQRHGIWVVDVADQTSKYLSRRVRLRQKAYLHAWHVGDQPFVSKWRSTLLKQNQ